MEVFGAAQWASTHLHIELFTCLWAMQDATDDLLTRQFTALSAALGDDVPAVRVAAVAGVCTVLDAFWDLIPPATTAAFVQRLASERLRPRVPGRVAHLQHAMPAADDTMSSQLSMFAITYTYMITHACGCSGAGVRRLAPGCARGGCGRSGRTCAQPAGAAVAGGAAAAAAAADVRRRCVRPHRHGRPAANPAVRLSQMLACIAAFFMHVQ